MSATPTQVATVWARALLGASGSDAPAVLASLEQLVGSIAEHPDAWDALCAPTAPQEAQSAAVDGIVSGAPAAAASLLRLLVERRRLADLPAIVATFAQLVADQQGDLDVTVTSAVELDPELRGKLEQRLSTTTGRSVHLHPQVDPEIIGGLILQYGDNRIDTSVRGRLSTLQQRLRTVTTNANQ